MQKKRFKKLFSYYRPSDLAEAASKNATIGTLVCIALAVLSRMPRPVYWVAGPVSSGPRMEAENRRRLRDTILELKIEGAAAFNYLPLLVQAMNILRRGMGDRTLSRAEEYALQLQLCEEFHAPIFRSQMIDVVCVLPDSEESLNVQWMRGFACANGIKIKPIREELVPKAKKPSAR